MRTCVHDIKPGGPRHTRVAGFSLVELLIMLVILSIISSVAISKYANAASNRRLDGTVQRILSDLELARAKAMAMGASGSVRFDTATGSYYLNQLADINRPDEVYAVDLHRDPYGASIVDLDLDGSGGNVLIFDPWGRPLLADFTPADTQLQIMISAGGRTTRVFIDAATGRPYVQ